MEVAPRYTHGNLAMAVIVCSLSNKRNKLIALIIATNLTLLVNLQ